MTKLGKIKVIELIPQMTEAGAETLVKDYALHIDTNQFDLSILVDRPVSLKSANVREVLQHGTKLHSPFVISNQSILNKGWRWLRKRIIPKVIQQRYSQWYIRHKILSIHPNVIHVHMQMLHHLLPIADKLKQVNLLYTCHSLPCRYFNENECAEERKAAQYLIKHNGLRMIGLHDEMRRELNKMFNVTNSMTLYNCVDVKRFQNVYESKEQIRTSINIPSDAFLIGHVGRFMWIKNQPFIVDVFHYVSQQTPNAYLLLVGDGDTAETIERLNKYGLKERCVILSHRGDIPRLLKAMDVFVFPSKLEGLPISCIEAQAAGLKCFVSNVVPCDVLLSEDAVPLDINDSAEIWASAILDTSIKGTYHNDITCFDTLNVIEKLEQIYKDRNNV